WPGVDLAVRGDLLDDGAGGHDSPADDLTEDERDDGVQRRPRLVDLAEDPGGVQAEHGEDGGQGEQDRADARRLELQDPLPPGHGGGVLVGDHGATSLRPVLQDGRAELRAGDAVGRDAEVPLDGLDAGARLGPEVAVGRDAHDALQDLDLRALVALLQATHDQRHPGALAAGARRLDAAGLLLVADQRAAGDGAEPLVARDAQAALQRADDRTGGADLQGGQLLGRALGGARRLLALVLLRVVPQVPGLLDGAAALGVGEAVPLQDRDRLHAAGRVELADRAEVDDVDREPEPVVRGAGDRRGGAAHTHVALAVVPAD